MAFKPVGIKDEVLNDLATRFLINIPDEDKDDPLKLCSHIEVAYWFYLDLMRPEDPSLPACSMKEFMATVFQHCPFLVRETVAQDLNTLHSKWLSHKYKKPTRGAIILNQNLTKCLLVQGYPSCTSWGFPKGKLERGEKDMDCAIREVYEETGFDIRQLIQSEHYLECQSYSERPSRMYIIPGVSEKTEFKPRVRKEIKAIQWFRIEDLPRHKKDLTSRQNLGKNPNSFFMVMPFISQLRKWITNHQKEHSKKSNHCTLSAAFQSPSPRQQRSLGPVTSTAVAAPYSSPQSIPSRAVSGPVGAGMRMKIDPGMGTTAQQQQPQPIPFRTHSVPHSSPLLPPSGPPHQPLPGTGLRDIGPSLYHEPLLHPQYLMKSDPPVSRRSVTLLPTPSSHVSSHPPHPSPLPPHPSQPSPLPTHLSQPSPLPTHLSQPSPLPTHPSQPSPHPIHPPHLSHSSPHLPYPSHSSPHPTLPSHPSLHSIHPSHSSPHPTLLPHPSPYRTHSSPYPPHPPPHSIHPSPYSTNPMHPSPLPTHPSSLPTHPSPHPLPYPTPIRAHFMQPSPQAVPHPQPSHVTKATTSTFNPFLALGISTTAIHSQTTSIKSPALLPSGPGYIPFSQTGSGTAFGSVMVELHPAPSWQHFRFDRSRILSVNT